jgi:hypothetical protein
MVTRGVTVYVLWCKHVPINEGLIGGGGGCWVSAYRCTGPIDVPAISK